MEQKLSLKKEIFFQNGDKRYILQSPDGKSYWKQNAAVTDELIQQHLQGTVTIAAYTTYQNTCLFCSWDIDVLKAECSKFNTGFEAFEAHKNGISEMLEQFDSKLSEYPHYFEFSGNRGVHIWLFFDEPIPSEEVYQFLRDTKDTIKFDKEIFDIDLYPAQAITKSDGNGIKLPLALHKKSGKRSYWCDINLNKIILKTDDIKLIKRDNFKITVPVSIKKQKSKTKVKKSKTNPASNSTIEYIPHTKEGLERLEKRCAALGNRPQAGIPQSNAWHIFVGAVFLRLNLPDKVHETLAKYADDYKYYKTNYHIKKMMEGMGKQHPIGCKFAAANGLCNHPCHTVTPFEHLSENYPIFLNEVQNTSTNFVTTSTNPPLFSLSTASVNLNTQMTNIFSKKVIPQAKKAMKAYHDIFAMNSQSTAGKAIVLNTIPGGFKTTATIEMIVDALSEDNEFGAVIAVERNVDVKRIANEINSKYGQMFRPAYAFYGYDAENPKECVLGHKTYKPGMCDKKNCNIPMNKCRVKMNHMIQHNYRIIVISHQRLKMYSQTGEMKHFQHWHNSMSSKFRRTHLIIDEQPPLLEIIRFDTDSLYTFLSILPQLENGIQFKQDFTQPVYDLLKYLNTKTNAREVITATEIPEFKFDACFETTWKDFTLEMPIISSLPVALESLYNYGGIYINKNLSGLPEISTGYYLNNSWDFDRTIILDGTADISQRYKPQFFDKVYVPQLHTYEHLTFYSYNRFNLSRSTYKNKIKLIPSLNKDIKEIVKKRDKVYVVVYKENRESYERELEKEIKNGNVILRTFGSTRGDNSMRDCDTIIFTGLIHKGELNYLSESLILNQDYKMNLNAQKHRKSRKFRDRNTEIIKISSWLEDFVQEVYRTRLRSHNLSQDVQAYLIVSDPDFLNLIEDYFKGCKIADWDPIETEKNIINSTVQQIVEIILYRIKAGEDKIQKKSLGINREVLKKTLQRYPEINKILNANGVEICNRYFRKM